MKRQLGDAAAEIVSHDAELETVRKAAKLTEQENVHTSMARFEAAKAKLSSPDPDERLAARRKLAQELRLRIDRIELQPDRTMLVRLNDGRDGETLVELIFTAEGATGIRYFRGDRSFPLGGPAELALMELARESPTVSLILGNCLGDLATALRRTSSDADTGPARHLDVGQVPASVASAIPPPAIR
jgi:hypothetical protein